MSSWVATGWGVGIVSLGSNADSEQNIEVITTDSTVRGGLEALSSSLHLLSCHQNKTVYVMLSKRSRTGEASASRLSGGGIRLARQAAEHGQITVTVVDLSFFVSLLHCAPGAASVNSKEKPWRRRAGILSQTPIG